MDVSVGKMMKCAIKILRTTIFTHNALITRHSWHSQLSLEKQRIFMIVPLFYAPMSVVSYGAL